MKKILLILLSVLFLSSCTGKNENVKLQKTEKPSEQSIQIKKYVENEKAKNIVNSILENKEVNRAVAVVTGNTALIGLDIKDQAKSNYYKTMAVQKVRMVDQNIKKIEVTTDPNMYQRISKLNEDILNDKPLSGVGQEFMTLLKSKK